MCEQITGKPSTAIVGIPGRKSILPAAVISQKKRIPDPERSTNGLKESNGSMSFPHMRSGKVSLSGLKVIPNAKVREAGNVPVKIKSSGVWSRTYII